MDLLIMGHPRSGSTVMAELLNFHAEGQLMVDEPRGAFYLNGLSRSLQIKGMKKWGVKQVRRPAWRAALGCNPKRILLVVRDPEHSVLSYVDRCKFIKDEERRIESAHGRAGAVLFSVEGIMEMKDWLKDHAVVSRYEDFVRDPRAHMECIEEELGWKANWKGVGERVRHDKRFGGRKQEWGKHAGKVTTKGHDQRIREVAGLTEDDWRYPMFMKVREGLQPYRRYFGYA